jgi:hypothetical protein
MSYYNNPTVNISHGTNEDNTRNTRNKNNTNNTNNTNNASNVAHLLRVKEDNSRNTVEDRVPVSAASYASHRLLMPVVAGSSVYATESPDDNNDSKEDNTTLIPQIAGASHLKSSLNLINLDPQSAYMQGYQMRQNDPACNVFTPQGQMSSILPMIQQQCNQNGYCIDGYMAADFQRRKEPKCYQL